MGIYLDTCCLNRPLDHQRQARIRIEAEAKLEIQGRILAGDVDRAWSYMVDFENAANPFEVRQNAIAKWRDHATDDIGERDELLAKAKDFARHPRVRARRCSAGGAARRCTSQGYTQKRVSCPEGIQP